MEERRPPSPRETTEDRPRWMAIDPPSWTWLIIEHAPGSLEDLGFVETQTFIPVAGHPEPDHQKLQWRSPDHLRSGAITLGPDDRTPEGDLKQPFTASLPDGTRQRWYLGRAAHRLALETGLLWTFPVRHFA